MFPSQLFYPISAAQGRCWRTRVGQRRLTAEGQGAMLQPHQQAADSDRALRPGGPPRNRVEGPAAFSD
jgi:hypothetical protein